MPNPSPQKRALLKRLFVRENGLCYWCDGKTYLTSISHGVLPHDAATIDHLRDRYNPSRWAPLDDGETEEDRLVCACHACNETRGQKSYQLAHPTIIHIMRTYGRRKWENFCRVAAGAVDLSSLDVVTFEATLHKTEMLRVARPPRPPRPVSGYKYPPLPPVPPEEQGPRIWDSPVFFEPMREAAE